VYGNIEAYRSVRQFECETDMNHPSISRACLLVLAMLQFLMLMALMARLPPHPPEVTTLFAMGPFLAASISLAVAAALIHRHPGAIAPSAASVAALAALISFGPQKFSDAAFSQIWPAVLLGQAAAALILWNVAQMLRLAFHKSKMDRAIPSPSNVEDRG